jgi:hypothetical protein
MEFEAILAHSAADENFKEAVRGYQRGVGCEQIHIEGHAPNVKVQRLLVHLLATESGLPIESISLRGRSGCSDFVGTVSVRTPTETRQYDFVWDCRWRAEEHGWTDSFGLPDQVRAAREFDWRCFRRWQAR